MGQKTQNSGVRYIDHTVAALRTQKVIVKKKELRSREKELKAYDLSSLLEFLPELKDSHEPTRAAEFELILKEAKLLGTVLDHPAFQADPHASIYQHLMSTQPVMIMDEKPQKKKKKRRRRRRRQKKSKASAGPQSKDFHISTLYGGFSSIHLDD